LLRVVLILAHGGERKYAVLASKAGVSMTSAPRVLMAGSSVLSLDQHTLRKSCSETDIDFGDVSLFSNTQYLSLYTLSWFIKLFSIKLSIYHLVSLLVSL
jgi:hypothetical protein